MFSYGDKLIYVWILNPEGQTSISDSSRVENFEQAQKVSAEIKDYSITE